MSLLSVRIYSQFFSSNRVEIKHTSITRWYVLQTSLEAYISNRKITVPVFKTATPQTFRVPFHSTSLTLDTLNKTKSKLLPFKVTFQTWKKYTFMWLFKRVCDKSCPLLLVAQNNHMVRPYCWRHLAFVTGCREINFDLTTKFFFLPQSLHSARVYYKDS